MKGVLPAMFNMEQCVENISRNAMIRDKWDEDYRDKIRRNELV